MRNKVKNIAIVQTGVFLRTGKKGQVTYLQAKYFNDYGELREELIPDLKQGDIQERHLLQDGDILFCAKGTRNFATVYRSKYGPCVASSTFLIIRLNSKKYIPEFLALILNNFQASEYFRENNLTGTTVNSISKKIIEEFEIGLIDIGKQEKLLNIYNLHKKQIGLLENLINKKDKLIKNIILQYNNYENG
ncbi:hypothetical protein CSB07_01180 [Candidatus Gracilibacteria bacterium]|nr:MAG: hypothetical protein CSB07_01180 [Candidatus Gracilibacteria bacterium]PIE85600.1 MAG: hypothetical protein CSA08_01165 [Candidatus Gracilibacteria bacterium]